MKIKTEMGEMATLIDVYDELSQIMSDMEPLFGGLCGCGMFQDAMDKVVRLIEYNADNKGMDVESDEWIDFLYRTLGNDASAGERAQILLGIEL